MQTAMQPANKTTVAVVTTHPAEHNHAGQLRSVAACLKPGLNSRPVYIFKSKLPLLATR